MTIEIGLPPLWILAPLLTMTTVLSGVLTIVLIIRFAVLWSGPGPGKGTFRPLYLFSAIACAYVSVLLLACDLKLQRHLRYLETQTQTTSNQ